MLHLWSQFNFFNMSKYIPNLFTILRLLLVPVILILFFDDQLVNHYLITLIIFFFAMLTDVIDGWIARQFNLITKLGIFLDPLADKILINIMLFAFVSKGVIPFWLAAALFARDLISSDFKSFATQHKIYVAIAPIEGKIKAFLETVGLLAAFGTIIYPEVVYLSVSTNILLYLALFVGLIGLIRLFRNNWSTVLI